MHFVKKGRPTAFPRPLSSLGHRTACGAAIGGVGAEESGEGGREGTALGGRGARRRSARGHRGRRRRFGPAPSARRPAPSPRGAARLLSAAVGRPLPALPLPPPYCGRSEPPPEERPPGDPRWVRAAGRAARWEPRGRPAGAEPSVRGRCRALPAAGPRTESSRGRSGRGAAAASAAVGVGVGGRRSSAYRCGAARGAAGRWRCAPRFRAEPLGAAAAVGARLRLDGAARAPRTVRCGAVRCGGRRRLRGASIPSGRRLQRCGAPRRAGNGGRPAERRSAPPFPARPPKGPSRPRRRSDVPAESGRPARCPRAVSAAGSPCRPVPSRCPPPFWRR